MQETDNFGKSIQSLPSEELSPEDRRDVLIPGWDEVKNRFKLDQLSPSQQQLIHAYYRIQRWNAEKGTRDKIKPKKPKRLMHAISPLLEDLRTDEIFNKLERDFNEDLDFVDAFFASEEYLDFFEEEGPFLRMIASYVRHPTEKKRQLLKERQMPVRE